jgi:hypothetical protein
MRKIYLWLLSAFAISFSSLCAQDTISAFVYNTSRDFLSDKPNTKTWLVLEKYKRDSAIYKTFALDKYDDYEILDISIWGFFYDSTLYLNCKRMGMGNGFARIKELGKYAYFRGRPITNAEDLNRMANNSLMFGLIGGIITEEQIRKQIKNNRNYIINLETGVCNLLTKGYIQFILREEKDLLAKFNNEPNQDSIDILITYIKLVNSKYQLSSMVR